MGDGDGPPGAAVFAGPNPRLAQLPTPGAARADDRRDLPADPGAEQVRKEPHLQNGARRDRGRDSNTNSKA